ncbi:MAG TPA: glycosyltransferase family 39 protein [Terriglobales bacterium]|jgi:hypothetical protein|nr:glycosyltransferase family 39 protein [Terriglobales bacterium]
MVPGKVWWRKWEYAAVFLLLALMAVLAIAGSRQQSPTYDEVVHVPSGLSYLQKHDARLNLEHPPLLKIIAALPLLFSDARANYNDRSWCGAGGLDCQWTFGKRFFTEWNRDPAHIVFLARLPMIFLALCFGLAVYLMARALAGKWGALLSLAVFATSPFYLGYGSLVITDIGLALFCLLTAWFTAALWTKPGFASLIVLSLATAAALLSKFSALLLVPSIALFWAWMWITGPRDRARLKSEAPGQAYPGSRKFLLYMPAAGILAILLTASFYWLTCSHSSAREIVNARNAYVSASRPPERILAATAYVLAKHPRWEKPLQPLWLYLGGIGYLNAGLSRPVYLLGKLHGHGVWYYFPVIAFFKLAPGEVLLFLLLGVLTALQLRREHLHHEHPEQEASPPPLLSYVNRVRVRALMSFFFVFLAAAMRSKLNIGVRHISVPLSILVVLLALIVPQANVIASPKQRRLVFSAVALLAFSCLITAVAAFPYYISYFNDFRLGVPKQEITTDSNLDWGQALPAVAAFAAQQKIQTIYVESFTLLPPAAYIPQAKPWKCDNPGVELPQWAAVSTNFLTRQEPTCIGLMKYQHWQLPGDAMVVFHITDQSYAETRRQYLKTHPNASVSPPVR